jgi:Mrp family chromosome partitioning ATPase
LSRLLDALRQLEQPAEPARPATQQKVMPRLAASIRRAVLGKKSDAQDRGLNEPEVLFRIPQIGSDPARIAAALEGAAAADSPETPTLSSQPSPSGDPLSLVDAIAATLREASREEAASVPAESVATKSASPSILSSPIQVAGVDPSGAGRCNANEPTPGERAIHRVLADNRSAGPYRDWLQALLRATDHIDSAVVALMSLEADENSAFVAASLGSLLCEEADRRVLLLEGHGASRELGAIFHASHREGLCEMLARQAKFNDLRTTTSQPRLTLLPFGKSPAVEFSHLLVGLGAAVNELRDEFDAVVIDAGPLNTPWSLAAARTADVVYLLVQLGQTPAELAVSELKRFRASGGKVSGCIAFDPSLLEPAC